MDGNGEGVVAIYRFMDAIKEVIIYQQVLPLSPASYKHTHTQHKDAIGKI